ncbi:EF-hand calcium-binding domain-containing protein 10 [Callorhinchus milii]|uniref:EF-hand calcium-binding domain-containing protein 10 n=1 Tax=Callorhinchus milii TaxID=7868 RepID=V9LFW4_CALMI|nr:EF-hand calcium-binding domain-containing protein 10 [Callorhinchus milii]|eukprot:gi/632961450/ref/XP_007896763.1/ PREDICTED: EF-hand calcium-binding domain-containing protein 10-like [Callorhinchus milii]
MEDPREQEASAYLREHKVLELLENLTSMLLYHRPDNPREFLITELENVMTVRDLYSERYPCLFDDSNLVAIYGILDTTKQGFITQAQYVEAFKTLGITDFDESPIGTAKNQITLETFKIEAKYGLKKTYADFKKTTLSWP